MGVAGGLLAAVVGAWAALRARGPHLGSLELVDLSFTRDFAIDPGTVDESAVGLTSYPVRGFTVPHDAPALDVKLRNLGGQPAFVKRVVFETTEAVALRHPPVPQARRWTPITATAIPTSAYDVELPFPDEDGGFTVAHDISQVVPPVDIDRFLVRLALRRGRKAGAALFRLRVRLIYNAEDQQVVSEPLIFALPNTSPHMPSVDWMRRSLHQFVHEVRDYREARLMLRLRRAPLGRRGPYTPEFWEPEEAIRRYLDREKNVLRGFLSITSLDGLCDTALDEPIRQARTLLEELPGLRAELLTALGASHPAEVQSSPPPTSSEPQDARRTEAEAAFNAGMDRADQGDMEGALAAFRQAARLRPHHPQSWFNTGLALDHLGRHEEAAKIFDRYIELRPLHPEGYYEKAVELSKTKRYEAAIAAYDQAIEADRDYKKAYVNKVHTLNLLGRHDEAAVTLDRFANIPDYDPVAPYVHANRGNALIKLGRWQEALEAIDRALRLAPGDAEDHRNRALALEKLGRHDEARAAYTRARELDTA